MDINQYEFKTDFYDFELGNFLAIERVDIIAFLSNW